MLAVTSRRHWILLRLLLTLLLPLTSAFKQTAMANGACAVVLDDFFADQNPYRAAGEHYLNGRIPLLEAQLNSAINAKDAVTAAATIKELYHSYTALYRPVEAAWTLRRGHGAEAQAQKIIDSVEKTLSEAQVIAQKPLGGGISETILIDLPGELKGVSKPEAKSGAQNWASHHHHEIATYLVDKMLGIDVTPVTVEATIGGRVGSLQYFIKNASLGGNKSWRLKLLDYLVANLDRHGRNYMTSLGGSAVAIDHGITFGVRGHNGYQIAMNEIMPTKEMWDMAQKITTADLERQLLPLLEAAFESANTSAPEKRNSAQLQELLSGNSRTQFDKFVERFEAWKTYVRDRIDKEGDAAFNAS